MLPRVILHSGAIVDGIIPLGLLHVEAVGGGSVWLRYAVAHTDA